jgi:sulfur carrier protein
MRVELNGKPCELPDGATLADAVRASGARDEGRGVAAALDGEVVARAEWDSTPLAEDGRVEVLAAIQGGAEDVAAAATGFVSTPSRGIGR